MKILEIENYGKALKEVSHVRQTSFIELYNLIMEHATGLFTPATLLKLIMNKLHEYPEVVLTKQELLRYSNCDSYKYFNDIINSLKFQDNYELHILHIYPLEEAQYLNAKYRRAIYNYFYDLKNEMPPAATFDFGKFDVIIINAEKVPRNYKNSYKLETYLDHELNHLFEPNVNKTKKYPSFEDHVKLSILKEINDKYHLNINVDDITSAELNDYLTHMFSTSEFYEMTADLCNVLSLYFKEKDSAKLFNKLESMLTSTFLNSNEFKQLEEPIKGSILFAYICKNYSKDRWKIVLAKVKEQLNLTGISGSIKIFISKLKENLKKLCK